jgi:hypothetical protein
LATWVHDLNAFGRLDVTNTDGRAKLEFADVQYQFVHEILGSSFDFDPAYRDLELTTTANARALTFEYDGDLDLYGVTILQSEEVDVAKGISNWVELVILHDRLIRLTCNSKLSELKFRGVNEGTDIKGLDGKVDRITGTVENGGNETFTAGSLA